ncbi:hypothetical protein EHH54_05830 [Rhizobium leguminosarum]|uniref:hypothetical protein n=1 Tax=Rhizobium leguminosarum TaxID=384 RepID=UPI000FEC4ED5|nr:hypothetical protein [Rhizobium leguminosarum]RWX41667.1 hypothetical protein EHH54_05830 [Rhizobium leguminosarum]
MGWIASVIITLAILYLRAPDIWPARFWAEDLFAFLMHAQHDGIVSLVESNAGYLHTVPRLISLAALTFPMRYAPEVFLFFVLFFTGWAASIIARTIGGFPGILAGAALILASGWSEPVGSVTNLQWLLAPTLLLLSIRPGGVSKAEGIVFAMLASTSGPFTIAFAPVYLFVLANDFLKRRAINPPALIAVASAPIQLIEVMLYPNTPTPHGGSDAVWLFGRIVELSAAGGLVALLAIALCGVSVLVGTHKLQRALLIGASLLLTAIVVAKFRHDTDIFISGLAADRYWYVQGVIWLLVGFCAIRETGLVPKIAGVLAVAILVTSNIYTAGLSRVWFGVGGGWAEAVEKSYSSPVRFEYAPNWAVTLENGVIYRAEFP